MSEFKNKCVLITGGTGSFGRSFLNRVLDLDFSEIRIFSRDEKKQDDLRKELNNQKIKFYIGDVRDKESLMSATIGVDMIFHAAALKQVPSCEFYPTEAVKTNILGTENLVTKEPSVPGINVCVCVGVTRQAQSLSDSIGVISNNL